MHENQHGIIVQGMETVGKMITENGNGLHIIDDNLISFRDQIINEPQNSQILVEITEMKEYFEKRIRMEMDDECRQIPNRVREITEEGKETICQTIKIENEQTRNMVKFMNMDFKRIIEQLEQRGMMEQFHEYARNIIDHQTGMIEKIGGRGDSLPNPVSDIARV
jgi:predicted ribonuclease YlaK